MFKHRKKVIIILFGIHSILYVFISDYMLEYEIRSNFHEFNDRRLASKYNVDGNEEFYFGSCGDEFFRDQGFLKDFVEDVSATKRDRFSEGYYRNVSTIDPYSNFTELITTVADREDTATCIIFNVCKISKVLFLYTKVNQVEIFSSHTDFHGMLYNDQVIESDIYYVWILFRWFRVAKRYKSNNN